MKQLQNNRLNKRIKLCIWTIIIGLFLSGITAFPIETQLTWFLKHQPELNPTLSLWLNKVYTGVKNTNNQYPFISYGTDWLAFAHVMLAVLFIGPLINPVRNIWVVQFGIIAALAIFPLAFIAGSIRSIPFFWQCIDCSFGVVTLAILLPCYKWIKQLEATA
ncbi:hypothetical protein [Mucilaginibacter auburnensis]|uniref:Vitamin K epoxide reductase family protein n=1 Tax=Mucilaginibacter auburnensis TaxID=1457233 RepID=A0A2H9VUS1_9SPHI|nr:hypothetical protein [Mucilaginibacter auburnensis]PJJ84567.1 hypothetical protein CLV57_1580 [Mucilaginibacter auburnensis]